MKNHLSNRLLIDLINCRSITPNDSGCQDIIKSHLSECGFSCEVLKYDDVTNLWATTGTKNGPTLCFAGHTDVVPPGPEKIGILILSMQLILITISSVEVQQI